MRTIPKTSKVKLTFWKDVTIADAAVGLTALAAIAITCSSNFSWRFYLAAAEIAASACLFIPAGNERLYVRFAHLFRFLFRKKTYKGSECETICPYKAISENAIENRDGSLTGAIEVDPIDFQMLTDEGQDAAIEGPMSRILNSADEGETVFLEKVDRPLVLDGEMKAETERIATLADLKRDGLLSQDEHYARCDITQSRMNAIDGMNDGSEKAPRYYIAIAGTSKASIDEKLSSAITLLGMSGITAKRLGGKELAALIRYGNGEEFDERGASEKDALTPSSARFGLTGAKQCGKQLCHFAVYGYPTRVPNGWAGRFFSIPNTKAVLRASPVPKDKAMRRLDNAILELQTKQGTGKTSEQMDRSTHEDTLESLLAGIQEGGDTLFDATLLITSYDEPGKADSKKAVRTALREMGLQFTEMPGRQEDAYISSFLSSTERTRVTNGIPTGALAASFPFDSDRICEENGLYMGESAEPAFIDFWKRGGDRINSNAVIIGQSGSGKSYATKALLAGLASSGVRVFVLDPEDEYGALAKSLGGQSIDVATGARGRINPFQIVGTMGEEGAFYTHLQFLEGFYRLILQGISPDALELLNRLTGAMYQQKGIGPETKAGTLKEADYPTFDDLFALIEKRLSESAEDYERSLLRTLENYVSRFTEGGRDSDLWDGPTTLRPKEAFVAFDFQRLFESKNDVTANAQMSLILRWLENEVIENRARNERDKTDRKVAIAIDEAHLFIDEKRSVALDFMYQMAKRIRKYDGMLIVVTQNVKDFAGSPEIARKTTALINVSQYSLIFNLSPSDMSDLRKLYEGAGGINERECYSITHSPRGRAFLILSPNKRAGLWVGATELTEKAFGKEN